ncbi:MAG: hypothetical protein Q9187_001197 [Circinaria calcarea]
MGTNSPPSRATSNPGSDYTRKSRNMRGLRISADDMWMPSSPMMNSRDFKFTVCSHPGCANSSAFSEYYSTTLRAGFDTCTNHTTTDSVVKRISTVNTTENTTFIFYDIEVTSSNEIDQLSAVTVTGEHIDLIIKTSSRRNRSPIISKFTPMVYMMMAVEPRVAMERFVMWVNMIMNKRTNGSGVESDVVLVAHNGMCHDHVMLLKTMMLWGMNPPRWRLSDSLPIFKIVTRPDPHDSSKLSTLANIYAPWYPHVEHDGLSDAIALKNVVTAGIGNWQLACYVFSSTSEYFITSVGLNTFKVRSPLPFPTTSLQ